MIKRVAFALFLMFICTSFGCVSGIFDPSEKEIRSKVVVLTGGGHLCSGSQVRAPSGTDYILSAGHCKSVIDKDGMVTVQTEDGRTMQRRFIAEDDSADLLLIEGVPHMEGIKIAEKIGNMAHLRSFTHGGGLKTYKTEGELIMTQDHVPIPVFEISGDEGRADCLTKPKYTVFRDLFREICALNSPAFITTVQVQPGSSGGMVVNSAGELTAVVSGGSPFVSVLVTLDDVRRFTRNY